MAGPGLWPVWRQTLRFHCKPTLSVMACRFSLDSVNSYTFGNGQGHDSSGAGMDPVEQGHAGGRDAQVSCFILPAQRSLSWCWVEKRAQRSYRVGSLRTGSSGTARCGGELSSSPRTTCWLPGGDPQEQIHIILNSLKLSSSLTAFLLYFFFVLHK